MEEATMTTCQHAAAGCNYPEADCAGHCHVAGEDSQRPHQHTQAPLTYRPHWSGRGGFELCFDPKGVGMAETPNWGTDEIEADTRRLVACWNVCEGVDTLELETAARYKALATGYRKRTEQRDMLLKALRMARWCVQADLDSLVETCRHPDGSMEAADAALVATYAEKLGIIDMAIKNGGAA